MAEAFCENPEGKPEVNHKDGDKSNNRASNLEWVTGKENVKHAHKIGLAKAGAKKYGAKLTSEDIATIKKQYISGDKVFGAKPLARKYRVSSSTTRNIVKGRRWKNE